jgi:hypothetical protein
MDEDTIWMVYTRHIPGIYQKLGFQMISQQTITSAPHAIGVDQTNTSQDVEDLQWAPAAPAVLLIAQPTNFALAARKPALVHVSIATDADMGRSFQAAMPGSVSNNNKCTNCDAGTYGGGGFERTCTLCAAGTYNDNPGASCTACPAGKYSAVTGASIVQWGSTGPRSSSGQSLENSFHKVTAVGARKPSQAP